MASIWKLNGVPVDTLGLDNLRLTYVNQQPDTLTFDAPRMAFDNLGTYATAPTVVIGGSGTGAAGTTTVSGGVLTGITLDTAGTGFDDVPPVTLTGGGGSGAQAYATITPTSVASVTVASTNSNFTSQPSIALLGGGGGSGATATAALTATSVASIALANSGTGYTSAPSVSITGGGGSGATGTATVDRRLDVDVTEVTAGGSGYTSPPTVEILGITYATEPTIIANIADGAVVSIEVTYPGSGIVGTPVLDLVGGGGSGADATVAIAVVITGLTLTAGGTGYTTTPSVSITGGGGSGAIAGATLTPTSLASITLTAGGSGFTERPTVQITGGSGIATATAILTGTSLATLYLGNVGGAYPIDTEITLTRNTTTWFIGVIRDVPRVAGPAAERVQFVAVGPWQWLERTPYVQSIAVAADPASATSSLNAAYSGRAVLAQSAAGAKLTLSQALGDVMDYMEAVLPTKVQKGNYGDLTMTLPWDEVTDLSCAEVLSRLLQFLPDAVCWWDYTTIPPTLNITRRGAMTSIDLPILRPGTSLGNDFEQAVRGGFDLRPRVDLQKTAVVLLYQAMNRANEAQWLTQTVDKHPSGAATVDGNGYLTAIDEPTETLVRTIQLAGSVWQGTILEQPVDIDPFPGALEFSGAITSGGTFDSACTWLKAHAPELKKANVTIVRLVDGTRTKPDGSAVTGSCANELMEGAITDWMEDDAGIVQEEQLVKMTVYIDIGVTSTGDKERQVLDVSVPVIGTNAATKTYTSLQASSYTAPEAVPTGLAEALYNAISVLHWDGSVELIEADPTESQLVGRTLNLTGGLAAWATMEALIQRAVIDIDSGTTEIAIGPARQLGPDDLVELYRVNRNRLPVTSYLMRTTGKVGSDGQRKSLARIVPRTPIAGAARINPRKITKSITVAGVVPTVSEVQTALQAGWGTGDHPIAGDEIVLTKSSVPKLAYHVTLQNIGASGLGVVSFTVNSLTYYAYLTQIGIF